MLYKKSKTPGIGSVDELIYLNNFKLIREFFNWEKLQVLGRIYLATEGINAQLSVPEHCFDQFRSVVWNR